MPETCEYSDKFHIYRLAQPCVDAAARARSGIRQMVWKELYCAGFCKAKRSEHSPRARVQTPVRLTPLIIEARRPS